MVNSINITPSPRILEVIAAASISPIQALCELIDNSIDGFKSVENYNGSLESYVIRISLPKKSELENGVGRLVIKDNGPGMTSENLSNAVKAGYSGKENPLDTLGLYGVGFNIATGKLGRITKVKSTIKEDSDWAEVVLNIPEMISKETFDIPYYKLEKSEKDIHGTTVEISEWWEEGEINHQFIYKLVQLGRPKVREAIGRIYSTIIKNEGLLILVDDERVEPFYHCVWSKERYLIRRTGNVPAQIHFDKILATEYRCEKCWLLFNEKPLKCPKCNSEKIRLVEKRIRGWVGIQRFDNENSYGLDLIRNGRAIRTFEKDLFSWTDPDTLERILEYPVSGIYGRIVGEVHLDFVRTDYLKTDFLKTSEDWRIAVAYLHGETSILPKRAQARGEVNESPIAVLARAYGSVRDFGTKDMYMGRFLSGKDEADRLPRSEEKELYEKFKQGEEGYFSDEKWWELVETADIRPDESSGMIECPECKTQNAISEEVCISCGRILNGKTCINDKCKKEIPRSAESCPNCGEAQIIESEGPWECGGCGFKNNPPDSENCLRCGDQKGSTNSFSLKTLEEQSDNDEELSKETVALQLPGGSAMQPIKLIVRRLKSGFKLEKRQGEWVPIYTDRSPGVLRVFLDMNHHAFKSFQDRPEDYVAIELANWIFQNYPSLRNQGNNHLWSLPNLYYLVHEKLWKERIEVNHEETKKNVDEYFDEMSEMLPVLFNGLGREVYDNLDRALQGAVSGALLDNNIDLGRQDEFIDNGQYLRYIKPDLIAELVRRYPSNFFDGKYWTSMYNGINSPSEEMNEYLKKTTLKRFMIAIDDLVLYGNNREPDAGYTQKINLTLAILNRAKSDNIN